MDGQKKWNADVHDDAVPVATNMKLKRSLACCKAEKGVAELIVPKSSIFVGIWVPCSKYLTPFHSLGVVFIKLLPFQLAKVHRPHWHVQVSAILTLHASLLCRALRC